MRPPKKACPGEEHIAEFVDNKMEERRREEFIEHLVSCSECRGKVSDIIASMKVEIRQAPPYLVEKIATRDLSIRMLFLANFLKLVYRHRWYGLSILVLGVGLFTWRTAVKKSLGQEIRIEAMDETPMYGFGPVSSPVIFTTSTNFTQQVHAQCKLLLKKKVKRVQIIKMFNALDIETSRRLSFDSISISQSLKQMLGQDYRKKPVVLIIKSRKDRSLTFETEKGDL